MIHGVDLSHHNGERAAPLDVDFFIVRVSFGMPDGRVLPDLSAEAHLERASKIKRPILLAGYHYLSTAPHGPSGEDQAAGYLARLGELETRFDRLFGRACDSEPLRDRDSAGQRIPWDPVEVVRDRVLGFGMACAAARPCLMYGSREWWARMKLPWWFAMHCPFWAASQGAPPAPWVETAVQQTGVVGGVDRNVFGGTLAGLCEVFGLPEPASPCGG